MPFDGRKFNETTPAAALVGRIETVLDRPEKWRKHDQGYRGEPRCLYGAMATAIGLELIALEDIERNPAALAVHKAMEAEAIARGFAGDWGFPAVEFNNALTTDFTAIRDFLAAVKQRVS